MVLKEKLMKWWYLGIRNTTVRKGEAGGFRWRFRKFSVDFETLSGNFKIRFIAAEHPYGYLLAGKDDKNIEGFCQTVYEVGMLLTTDQGFVNDIHKAIKKYSSRLEKQAKVVEDEVEEKAALEFERQVKEHVELPRAERMRREKEIDKKFKKVAKDGKGSY